MRIDALLRSSRARLDAGEPERLLGHVLSRDPAWLFAHGDAEIDTAHASAFEVLVARREAGEPVAYLVGLRGFWTFDLEVGPATLIPRPETERLVELALERLPHGPTRVADLGTGSGAIALAIALERRQATVVAVDASAAALEVARRNVERLAPGRVELREGDWYGPLAGERFDLLLSNPPYIAEGDPHLSRGDLRHEPPSALASGADGLDAIRTLAAGARAHLRPGGWLVVEHGYAQGADVRALFAATGLRGVETALDLEDRERITFGCAL
ncbi:peptide chain release factor N(5)-glutamine methyltransferase [Lysobacter xanthus]